MVATHQPDRHALYRFYGETGQLIYLGITNDPGRRFGQHGAKKSWWPTVRGITIEWYSSRRDALAAEARAIEVERPLFNRQRPGVAEPPRTCGHCEGCTHNEPCRLYSDAPDDPVYPCEHCGRDGCLYALGHEHGSMSGWSAAAQTYNRQRGC